MIERLSRISDAGQYIISAQIREVGDNLDIARTAGKHLQHIRHAHARSGYRGTAATDCGINRDTRMTGELHEWMVSH